MDTRGKAQSLIPARAWLAVAATCLVAACHAGPTEPQSVTGDLIVKFRDSSATAQELAPVVTGAKPAADAQSVVTRLGRELGVPLRVASVTSGRELLLAVDRDAVSKAIEKSAARQTGIRAVQSVAAAQSVLPAPQMQFEVIPEPGAPTPSAAQLAGRFADYAAVSADMDRMVLTIDMAELTRATAEKLGKDPQVEYAQLNLVMRHQR